MIVADGIPSLPVSVTDSKKKIRHGRAVVPAIHERRSFMMRTAVRRENAKKLAFANPTLLLASGSESGSL